MKARFKMNLWQRIKAASLLWWAVVVTGEVELVDDEPATEGREALG